MGNLLLLLSLLLTLSQAQTGWETVDQILQQGITNGTYPGCTAIVVSQTKGVVYQRAFGNYTYGIPPPYTPSGSPSNSNPPMQANTLFDLASLSKVVATTTVVALLYQNGYIDLDMKISDPTLLGSDYAQNGKGNITIRNCLLHNAGYPPDPSPNYYEASFGCPASLVPPPPNEVFTCRQQIYNSLLSQKLQYPTNTGMVYSDLSFITLMFVTGKVIRDNNLVDSNDVLPACLAQGTGVDAAQCYYEAYVRQLFTKTLGMKDSGYLPSLDRYGDCAPTENDTAYSGGYFGNMCIQGVVSDGNAYSMGGIGGHAGVFSHILDLQLFLQEWMWGTTFRADVVKEFITQYNKTQSSRALGWDTNDQTITDNGSSGVCSTMATTTFLHTGYTGTMICATPVGNYFAVLLTTRVYPTASTGSTPINNVRRAFTSAVVNILGP